MKGISFIYRGAVGVAAAVGAVGKGAVWRLGLKACAK